MLIKVLIIEDDKDLASGLIRYLQNEFEVNITLDGTAGIKKFAGEHYQLVILDLKLPDMSGLNVCQELRAMEKETPILVLTGIADVETQVKLLDAGADDYVIKPFDGRQLRARIDALLRRTGVTSKAVLRTHNLAIDTRGRRVSRGDTPIALRRKEYDILEYLARNKGQVMSRAMISNNVWRGDELPNSIDVHIKHLRDKVDRPFDVPLIETSHGVGYLLKDLPLQ